MNDREALEAIQSVIDEAMPPDSGATVQGLLAGVSGVLAKVGLDQWGEGALDAEKAPAA